MSANEPKTGSIVSIIRDIETGKIELPNFQRDFVWDIEKSYELFDSIVKDIFIGVLIFGSPSFEIQVRKIETRQRGDIPRRRKNHATKSETTNYRKDEIDTKVRTEGYKLLLDGQQRVTSLYRALKGIDKIWMILNPTSVETIKSLTEKTLEEDFLENILFKFNGKEDEERLSIRIDELYDIYQNNYSDKQLKDKFLVNKKFYQDEYSELHLDFFRQASESFKRILLRDKIISYYLLDMSISKFALFFERSNSLGVQLSFIDILTAKIFDGFNLRDSIEEFDSKNKIKLVPETIVRTISFYASDKTETQKSYILKELNTGHFTKYWDRFSEYYIESYSFLFNNSLLISPRWIPYENMIIPLIVFRNEVGVNFNEINSKQLEFIVNWYWFSVFSSRYSGSTNEIIVYDSLIMSKVAENKIEDLKQKDIYGLFRKNHLNISEKSDLYEINKPTNAIYRGLLNLIFFNQKQLLNWNNPGKIDFDNEVHDHHIFPKNYIKKHHSDLLDYKNCVVNRTLIPKLTNLQIGDKSPETYLAELSGKNKDIDESMKNHLVDICDNNFEKFLETRAGNIFGIFEEFKVRMEKYASNFS